MKNKTRDVTKDNFMYCHLQCIFCSPDKKFSILVANDKYIDRYTRNQAWYQYEFFEAFIALVQHSFHIAVPSDLIPGVRVTMIRCPHPQGQIRKNEVIQLYGITHFVSVALARNHFAVLFYDIEQRTVVVYDGLYLPLKTWQFHITHTLRKYGLQELNYKAQLKTTIGEDTDEVLEICTDELNKPLIVCGDQILKQNDGYKCGCGNS